MMKTLRKLSIFWAAVVGFGILLTSDSLLASTSQTCAQNCQVRPASELRTPTSFDVEQFFLEPSKLVCSKTDVASYEYQDWFDWKPQIIKAHGRTQVASSYASVGGDRSPARSNN